MSINGKLASGVVHAMMLGTWAYERAKDQGMLYGEETGKQEGCYITLCSLVCVGQRLARNFRLFFSCTLCMELVKK